MKTHVSYHKPSWQVQNGQTLYLHKGKAQQGQTAAKDKEGRHGGVQARAWRQKIALLSTQKPSKKLRTLKFPLADAPAIDFATASQLYDVTEGLGKGSLIGLLCALHLAGFRVFQGTEQATAYRHQQAQGGQQQRQVLRDFFSEQYGLELTLDGANFIQSLATSLPKPKDRGEFDAATLADLLCKKMSGKGFKTQQDDSMKAFCLNLGEAILAQFGDWAALENRDAVLAWAVGYFRQQSNAFPDIAAKSEIAEDSNKCIAFDADKAKGLESLSDEDIARYGLHLVVACCTPETNLKQAIVSFNNNALAWLFGDGLRYLRKHSVDKFMADFAVPPQRRPAIERLLNYAHSLPIPTPLFAHKHYADFRQSVGGKITSWVTNYLTRLTNLHSFYTNEHSQALFDNCLALHDALQKQPECWARFRGLNDAWDSLHDAQQHYASLREQGLHATERLLGKQAGASVADVALMDTLSQTLGLWAGALAQVYARIEQVQAEPEAKKQLEAVQPLLLQCVPAKKEGKDKGKADKKIELPKAFPKISGGTADLNEHGAQAAARLNALIAAQSYFVQQAQGLHTAQVLAQFEAQEKQNAQAHAKAKDFSAVQWQTLAAQRFLHSLAGLIKRLEGDAAKKALRDLIQGWQVLDGQKQSKRYNRWLINQKGRVYVSPWSTARRHDAYLIRPQCWQGATWVEDVLALVQRLEANLAKLPSSELAPAMRNWLEYRNLVISWVMQADEHSTRTDTLPDFLQDLSGLSAPQRHALQQPTISNAELKRIINLMQSEIGQVRYGVLRPQVMVRTKFSRTAEKEVLYTIKPNKTWAIPPRYVAKYPVLKALFGEATTVDSAALEQALPRLLKQERQLASRLLQQFPHDWHLPWSLAGTEKTERMGVLFDGKGFPAKIKTDSALGRLQGSPAFKGALEKIIFDEAKNGDLTLLIDFEFDQQLSWKPDTGLAVDFRPGAQKLTLAVPLTENLGDETLSQQQFFERFIAFDQGERFISYAVFSVADYLEHGNLNPCVDANGYALVGKIATPAVLHLRQAVNQSRKKQATQKITDRYSKAMEKRREAAVGEISQRIDRLCAKYQAFPVLESQLDGFETGANQLKVVYGSLLHLYAFSGVDAHKAKRAHHWYGAENWQHPYVQVNQDDYVEDGDTGKRRKTGASKIKLLSLAPGATVHPAGTSKTCVLCQRDPIKGLYQHFEKHSKISVQAGGRCQLSGTEQDDGVVLIKKRNQYTKDKKERKALHQANRNPQLNQPVDAGEYGKELIQDARATLRQQTLLRNQRDTTQARYQCLYADCATTYHADEGAAINIGRKFLRRINKDASLAARNKNL